MKWRRPIQIAAPLASVATLMLGLRVGGGDAIRAAVVYGANPAQPPPGAKHRLAWQVLTFLEDRGVRETIAVKDLDVVARANGEEAKWSGSTNEDGVAEASLEFEKLPDFVDLEVRAARDPEPLAAGQAKVVEPMPEEADTAARMLRPTKRDGAIGLDVVIETGRLITGFSTPIWVKVTPPPGTSTDSLDFELEPEPGLAIDQPPGKPCGPDGWTEIDATAFGHVVGISITAKSKTSDAKGTWFGVLPVAAGAFQPNLKRDEPAGQAFSAVLVAPNPRKVVYAEVDDVVGRAYAAALDVTVEAGDPTPRARFEIPPLVEGIHWLVVSGEPRGAEKLDGATIAKPFYVGGPARAACSIGPFLAEHQARPFRRRLAVDGFPLRNTRNRGKHRLGMLIALVSLLAAATLEILLLSASAREARIELQLAELEDNQKVTAKSPGGGLAIGLLVAVLGFALLAALLVMKS
ncbi:MAG TPA: hypothetical protein VIF62_32810 [Labilithrix sp.]